MEILITPANSLPETGLDYIELISLTGIFGVHPKKEYLSLLDQRKIRLSIKKNDAKVTIEYITPEIKFLRVDLHLSDKTIHIDYFRVANKSNHVGFPRLIAQVEAGRKVGFEKIDLLAFGNFENKDDWDGYYVWGKYGFLMYNEDDIKFFDEKMIENGRTDCKNINDLVLTKEGTELWIKIGEEWLGEFNLELDSRSADIFNKYRQKRGL
jgi:hypothetical protein